MGAYLMENLKRTESCSLTERVLQFGEGNFLRGFVDWMIDRLNKEQNADLGVVVVQPLENGMCETLSKQDCLYHLFLRGLKDNNAVEEITRIECISRAINPYKDTEKFFQISQNPNLRFIISNTTEAGIEYISGQRYGDYQNSSFPGRLTMFLKRRYESGLDGFIFFPCELIDANGDKLKECILKYANEWELGEDFISWINTNNHFTNTLVDRIVTGYPKDNYNDFEQRLGVHDLMIDTAEIFHLWVIEGNKKLEEEIPFYKAGLNVIWTDDVKPYKKRKVRILNGAHTMSVLAARLMGLETVKEMMEDREMYDFIKYGVYSEIIPTLDLPENELTEFADDVFMRFKNPFIKHYLLSIALNSVSKFKVRVLPSIKDYINLYGKEPKCLVFSLAALILFYKTDEAKDSDEVIAFMRNATVGTVLSNTELWDEDLSYLEHSISGYIQNIEKYGMRDAIKRLIGELK